MTMQLTGFVHFFRAKIQGLLKFFHDPTLKFQGLFLVRIYHKPSKMFVFKPMFWACTLKP